MDCLDVILDGWVIADGIARELRVGQVVDSGLWFHTADVREANAARKHAEQIAHENYHITGQVLARMDDGPSAVWTIDFGIVACSERAPPPLAVQPGAYVTGDFRLQFDPAYFSEPPPVADGSEWGGYTWRVERIWANNW